MLIKIQITKLSWKKNHASITGVYGNTIDLNLIYEFILWISIALFDHIILYNENMSRFQVFEIKNLGRTYEYSV